MFSALVRLTPRVTPFRQSLQFLHVTQVNPAARKGTRERARKKKVKVEIEKVGFIPHTLRNKTGLIANKHIDDSWKQIPTDNVYPSKYYRYRTYSVFEALDAHRESNHPTAYDAPNAPVKLTVEMNMHGEKQTKFVTNFSKMSIIDYPFDHGEDRKILALTKDEDMIRKCLENGAALAGGVEIIKDIQVGNVSISDYHYVVAHPEILPEIVAVRGLMKKKFPNPKNDTLGMDVPELVTRYLNGINYQAQKDMSQQDFGVVETCIGTLNMTNEQLAANFITVVKDINTHRPKRAGTFITRVLIKCPPSTESLKINQQELPIEDYEGTRYAKKKKGIGKAEEEVTENADAEKVEIKLEATA